MYLGLSLRLPVRTAVATAAPTPVPTNRRLISAGNLRTISPDVYRSVQGSGSFPVWLPTAPSGDRPVAYADFKNGNYWYSGAIGTVNGWLANTALVVANTGLVKTNADANDPMVGVPLAYATALNWTRVTNFVSTDTSNGTYLLAILNDADTQEIGTLGGALVQLSAYDDTGGTRIINSAVSGTGFSGKIATTWTAAKSALSVAGGAVGTDTSAFSATPTISNYGGFETAGPTTYVFTIASDAFYAPQPDADLPTLSTP
jgi:hypothetical protein